MEKRGMRRGVFVGVWTAVFATALAFMIVLTLVLGYYDSIVTTFFGSVGGGITIPEGAEEIDSQYFKNDTDYSTAAEEALNKRIADEAIVLLRNEEKALPLKSGASVTLFGMASLSGTSTGSGSGEAGHAGESLSASLEAAGFKINAQVLEHYKNNSTAHGNGTGAGGGGDKGDWSLGKEADFPTGALAETFANYGDAAIFVLNRNSGEGGDLARTMDNHGGAHGEHYLELSPSERMTLEGICGSNAFDKVIVLVNTANAMELGFLEEYDVDAALWYAGLGANGIASVGEVLSGKVNPSGRLVDTYVYDNFSAAAMQNFGDYRFLFDGQLSDYSYINYAESIYVGYRYYETRYEDAVMQTPKVGDYEYASTVQYPFGYGLSYTDFVWSNYSAAVDGEEVRVSVDIKNNGAVAGKEVVQIYFQSEYTEYDKKNGIEKAAVNLVAFDKTESIAPGDTVTVEITFPRSDMKVYDSVIEKTYILEAGDYYITAAKNAHEAVNNILAAKGYTPDAGNGDADLAARYQMTETLRCDKGANAEITNLFDDAALDDDVYLTRSNWEVLDGGNAALSDVLCAGAFTTATGQKEGVSNTMGSGGVVGTMEATTGIRDGLKAGGYEASGNPNSKDSYTANRTYGEDNGLELVDLRGIPYDSEEWRLLLNQMKFSEIYELYGHAGYGTIRIDSINKPKTLEYDGPTGINSFVNNTTGYSFPNEISMAATWDTDHLYEEGRMIGNDMIKMSEGKDKVSGWYAPAVNIHRSPFSGRNFEYYSEDPLLSGKLVAQVIRGVQSKGVYVYLKHYALNDQETNRSSNGGVATFSTEQAIREIYLKPFELGVTEGGAKGLMTSNNRIGTRYAKGHYALNTSILRGEWGFRGVVITDYTGNISASLADQILASGGDLIMCSGWNTNTGVLSDYNAEWARALLRQAAHNTLYVQANSLAMNGFVHGAVYDPGFPIYKILLIALWVIVVAACGVWGFFVYRTLAWSQDEWYARKRIGKKGWIIIGCVVGAIVVALVVTFCVWLLPLLQKAFLM